MKEVKDSEEGKREVVERLRFRKGAREVERIRAESREIEGFKDSRERGKSGCLIIRKGMWGERGGKWNRGLGKVGL